MALTFLNFLARCVRVPNASLLDQVSNLGQETMMIGDQNLFQKNIVNNVMMTKIIINLTKKLEIKVEVAVKVAKILNIEKKTWMDHVDDNVF